MTCVCEAYVTVRRRLTLAGRKDGRKCRVGSTRRRITPMRRKNGQRQKRIDRRDRFKLSADQCCLAFSLYCGPWCFGGRPIELFHSILEDLSAARKSICPFVGIYMVPGPMYGA